MSTALEVQNTPDTGQASKKLLLNLNEQPQQNNVSITSPNMKTSANASSATETVRPSTPSPSSEQLQGRPILHQQKNETALMGGSTAKVSGHPLPEPCSTSGEFSSLTQGIMEILKNPAMVAAAASLAAIQSGSPSCGQHTSLEAQQQHSVGHSDQQQAQAAVLRQLLEERQQQALLLSLQHHRQKVDNASRLPRPSSAFSPIITSSGQKGASTPALITTSELLLAAQKARAESDAINQSHFLPQTPSASSPPTATPASPSSPSGMSPQQQQHLKQMSAQAVIAPQAQIAKPNLAAAESSKLLENLLQGLSTNGEASLKEALLAYTTSSQMQAPSHQHQIHSQPSNASHHQQSSPSTTFSILPEWHRQALHPYYGEASRNREPALLGDQNAKANIGAAAFGRQFPPNLDCAFESADAKLNLAKAYTMNATANAPRFQTDAEILKLALATYKANNTFSLAGKTTMAPTGPTSPSTTQMMVSTPTPVERERSRPISSSEMNSSHSSMHAAGRRPLVFHVPPKAEKKANKRKPTDGTTSERSNTAVKRRRSVSASEDGNNSAKGRTWWPRRTELCFRDITKLDVPNPPKLAQTSTLRGIYYRQNGRYKADIQVCGRSVFLGNYASRELACQAYDRMAIKVHGEDPEGWPLSQRLHFDIKWYEQDFPYIAKTSLEQLIQDIREDAKIFKLHSKYSPEVIKLYVSHAKRTGCAENTDEKVLKDRCAETSPPSPPTPARKLILSEDAKEDREKPVISSPDYVTEPTTNSSPLSLAESQQVKATETEGKTLASLAETECRKNDNTTEKASDAHVAPLALEAPVTKV